MNASMNDGSKTVIPAYETNGGLFGFLSAELPKLTGVVIEEINRATVMGNELVLEKEPSAPVLLPDSMNFRQTVLTGKTGITQHIRENREFAHAKDLFGRDVYYRRGVAKAPLNFRPVVKFVRKMMLANKKG